MFSEGSFAKVWAAEDKGKYSVVEISTSKKNKLTDKYETDFSNKFVRFIGTAHDLAKTLHGGETIKLGNCGVTTSWDKENKKGYTNFLVFSYSTEDYNSKPKADEELPY